MVDDLDEGITHIVRGEDHVTNTGVQLDIMEALAPGRRQPQLRATCRCWWTTMAASCPSAPGSLSLRSLRGDGIEPAALAGYLARARHLRGPGAGHARTSWPPAST